MTRKQSFRSRIKKKDASTGTIFVVSFSDEFQRVDSSCVNSWFGTLKIYLAFL